MVIESFKDQSPSLSVIDATIFVRSDSLSFENLMLKFDFNIIWMTCCVGRTRIAARHSVGPTGLLSQAIVHTRAVQNGCIFATDGVLEVAHQSE